MIRIREKDACTALNDLIGRAAAGEDIVIVREDGAAVRLVSEPLARPRFGSARGMFTMRDDFDAPLADFCSHEDN